MPYKILTVDDEKDMTRLLQRTLEPEIDCKVSMAFSAKMAMNILANDTFDLVICDIKMPGMDGFELLDHITRSFPDLTVVMLTAFGNIDLAVKATKKGAYDFISKPFDQSEIIYKIQKALERSRLLSENKRLLSEKKGFSSQLVGTSEAMAKVYEKISMIASSDVSVLILGESGTGKDMTAKTIHSLSPRKNQPFIPVNCPTIPELILESELFGYKKGAFTNAVRDKKGLFQEADKGTLFLDEIGDIGPTIQTKLLRAVQEKEIKPLGDTKTRKIDVRIIASTNSDLEKKMADHQFRQDFFYRLSVITIKLPPLRDRITDIPALAEHLVEKNCKKLNKEPKTISPEVMDLLMKQPWPGNIRELENVLIQGILYSKGEIINKADLPIKPVKKSITDKFDLSSPEHTELYKLFYKEAKEKILHDFNHDYIGQLLSMTNGNVTQAAKQCNLDRQGLQQIMKRFSINPDQFRT
ncbi:MAG: sigma-54-dependent Fis family transcriptional regulator [Desulfobacteraceae bacterium]|nr:sigma-54-dependent Fis family transcriptional regulator [Desulfobacteraceae bacterium]